MRTTTAILLLTFTLSIFTNCNNNKTKQREAIQHFADAYFNYQLDDALSLVTEDSRQWIEFLASNIDSADVRLLREMSEGATCEIEEIRKGDNDSVVIASIIVRNALLKDSIGSQAHVVDERKTVIAFVQRGEQWFARLSCLP